MNYYIFTEPDLLLVRAAFSIGRRRDHRVLSVRCVHTRKWCCGLVLGVLVGALLAACFLAHLDGKLYVFTLTRIALQIVIK